MPQPSSMRRTGSKATAAAQRTARTTPRGPVIWCASRNRAVGLRTTTGRMATTPWRPTLPDALPFTRSRSKSIYWVSPRNLLENTDGGRSTPSVVSRDGSLPPSSYADVRAVLMTSPHSAGRGMTLPKCSFGTRPRLASFTCCGSCSWSTCCSLG